MSMFANAVACLLCLIFAAILWKMKGMLRITLVMFLIVMTSGLYTAFAGNLAISTLENYPFRMLALTLCVFTTGLRENRRRFMVLAQTFWLWVDVAIISQRCGWQSRSCGQPFAAIEHVPIAPFSPRGGGQHD